ncbi:MAG: IS110 family transposase [Chloroflexi bacterium]|nr:IS110 family transposase [Chloroflexota bacterium]
MEIVHTCCCGLDVHKRMVVACLLGPAGKEVKTFGTMTADLLAMNAWLRERGCQMVAMESTGSYWKPLYNLLEAEGLAAMVVNAQHIKAVPGRKTDVKDAEWIAQLLQHGLLKASFIPDRDQRELAELVRYRRSLVQMRSAEGNRVQKVLEGANIKLGSVLSDVLGVSGRAVLERLIAGEEDGAVLAGLVQRTVRAAREEIARAAEGRMGAHQRFLLGHQLDLIDALTRQIQEIEAEIGRRLERQRAIVERLQTIPGVGERTAHEILAAIGADRGRFPTHRHLAGWAKLCPGLHESAGRQGHGGIGQGHKLLRAALTEAARAAARSRTYLAAQYKRIARRRGARKAIVAVAHSILVVVYHVIKDGTTYRDLGANYFDERDKEKVIRRYAERIERLGKTVTIADAEPGAA